MKVVPNQCELSWIPEVLSKVQSYLIPKRERRWIFGRRCSRGIIERGCILGTPEFLSEGLMSCHQGLSRQWPCSYLVQT